MNFASTMKTNGYSAAEQIVHATELPHYVVDRRCDIDLDLNGKEVILIWLVVTDGKRVRVREMDQNRDTIRAAFAAAAVSLWPSIHYRTVSEQRGIDRIERRQRARVRRRPRAKLRRRTRARA